MRISILTTSFFHDAKEVTRMIDGKPIKGQDKIIFGGAERYTVDLCHLLQEDGHAVTVYQPFPGINKPFSKKYQGITFVMIPNSGGWEYNTCTDLNWQFNEYSALDDLRIYMAQYLAWPNAVSPCITISHGIYWDNSQGNNIIKNLSEEQKKEFFKRQMYGFTQADACVAVDSNVRKVIQSMEAGSEKRIHVIYNYVDTQKFIPAQKTVEGINVLFPRRLTVLRGSTEVTKAFINLPEYNFTVAGQAHDENAAKAYFKSHENRKNVKFIHKEMDEMPAVYQQADISLVPTISTEGLSLSLLESMASGLPVITTPVGGLGDAVIDGYNALIYDPNHDNICDYIQVLAEDKETRIKMGQRNREIAVECFDIEIWKQRWRNLLAQFGVVSEKQYIGGIVKNDVTAYLHNDDFLPKEVADKLQDISTKVGKTVEEVLKHHKTSEIGKEIGNAIKSIKPQKPKLVAMMLTHNDADRYLECVIENTLKFCDEIVIMDDHSNDDTFAILIGMQRKYENRVWIRPSNKSWDNESELRQELLDYVLSTNNPDWLIAIDSDEIYEADKMNEQLPYLLSQTDADWVGFRFYDMWDEEHYRDDNIWPAGKSYAPRMFRVNENIEYAFTNQKRHCGSIPVNVLQSNGINSSVRVKHLGWMNPKDKFRKFHERIEEDPNSQMFPREIYDAILTPFPTLVKWDDNNPWQTSKLTIAYPPGMEWNVMQQRPHHLLRYAASERYRVFFGDDTAPGTYEPIPYLTVVNDFESIKDVDVLYITSPAQMDRCKNIKYKTLIYDCCDWQHYADSWLICNADYILCASKLLYDKIVNLKIDRNEDTRKVSYLPNACDFDHFSETGEPNPEIPEPVIGYMGCIHPIMVDEKIVNAIAEKYKLLMIGQNKGMQFDNPNIYTTDHVQYEHLPKLLSQCKVGIIPFRTDSDYLRYSAPIKVYEYLAAGRPVVASPIPELIPLAEQGLIQIVANADIEGWINAIEWAINEYPNTKGQEWAKNQTWINRYVEFRKILEVISK